MVKIKRFKKGRGPFQNMDDENTLEVRRLYEESCAHSEALRKDIERLRVYHNKSQKLQQLPLSEEDRGILSAIAGIVYKMLKGYCVVLGMQKLTSTYICGLLCSDVPPHIQTHIDKRKRNRQRSNTLERRTLIEDAEFQIYASLKQEGASEEDACAISMNFDECMFAFIDDLEQKYTKKD